MNMNILMILETRFPPDLRVENEIDALLEAGHKVTIIAGFREKLPEIAYYGKAKIIRVFLPLFIYKSSIGALNFPFYFSFWKKKIKQELLKTSYDALHIHDLPLSEVVLNLRAELKQHFKITLDLHENYPDFLRIAKHTQSRLGKFFFNYRQWLNYEARMVKLVDTVITVVEEMQARVIKLGAEPTKVIVVSNTFNSSKFLAPQRKPQSDELILFYGGGITVDRGLQFVIPALKELEKSIPNIKLWVVGFGSYLADLQALAKAEKVENLVKFFGQKPFEELLDLLSQSHIALIPHLKSPQTESGLPHKLFQYMVTGIPIIASNCKPFIRVLEDNQAGLIYTYDQPTEFVARVLELYEDKAKQAELVANARKVLQEKYLWEYDAKRLVKVY